MIFLLPGYVRLVSATLMYVLYTSLRTELAFLARKQKSSLIRKQINKTPPLPLIASWYDIFTNITWSSAKTILN